MFEQMSNPETVFDSPEHEYATAGWLGTIGVMKSIGELEFRRWWAGERVADETALLYGFCNNIARGADIPTKIHSWAEKKQDPRNEERIGTLGHIGIVHANRMTEGFADGYGLFTDKEWLDTLLKETPFGRLEPIIGELSAHYTPNTVPPQLTEAINAIRRDITFYTGHYDPGF